MSEGYTPPRKGEVEVNLNHRVRVKLTPYGIAILEQQRAELNLTLAERGSKPLAAIPFVDSDGYWTTQLWTMMERLGPHIRMTGPYPCSLIVFVDLDS